MRRSLSHHHSPPRLRSYPFAYLNLSPKSRDIHQPVHKLAHKLSSTPENSHIDPLASVRLLPPQTIARQEETSFPIVWYQKMLSFNKANSVLTPTECAIRAENIHARATGLFSYVEKSIRSRNSDLGRCGQKRWEVGLLEGGKAQPRHRGLRKLFHYNRIVFMNTSSLRQFHTLPEKTEAKELIQS
jgi:hypothetical protein